jgi:hypothetical protein
VKLGEALTEAAGIRKGLAQVRGRISAVARYQEGTEPMENATGLLDETLRLIDRLEYLTACIHRTNSAAYLDPGVTITQALTRRDALDARHNALSTAADSATVEDRYGLGRRLHSELKTLTDLNIPDLRARADATAQERRLLDARLQALNWTTELLE